MEDAAVIDRNAFRELLRPLVTMFRATFGVGEWTVYYQALADVPDVLLQDAVVLASRDEARAFMPRPGELRGYAEQARLARLAASPWAPCEACAPMRGFIERTVDGVTRLAKCPCQAEHRDRLAAAGVPARSLAAGAVLDRSDEAAWAAVPEPFEPRRLPAGVAADITRIARAHRMPRARVQTDLDGRAIE
jgi:hypothetical protein